MAIALSPFGVVPYGGKGHKTKLVIVADTHTVIGPGTVLVAGAAGAVPLASDTNTAQVALIGVSLQYLAADDGTYCLCADLADGEFMVQSSDIGTTWTSELASAGKGVKLLCTGSYAGINTTTYRSKMTTTLTDAAAADCMTIQRLAPIPGNDLTATSYPIWVVRFNLTDVVGAV